MIIECVNHAGDRTDNLSIISPSPNTCWKAKIVESKSENKSFKNSILRTSWTIKVTTIYMDINVYLKVMCNNLNINTGMNVSDGKHAILC